MKLNLTNETAHALALLLLIFLVLLILRMIQRKKEGRITKGGMTKGAAAYPQNQQSKLSPRIFIVIVSVVLVVSFFQDVFIKHFTFARALSNFGHLAIGFALIGVLFWAFTFGER